jgi:hypothetical protein
LVERLGDEVVGPDADRSNRGVHVAKRGDHDHRHVRPIGDDALAEREAVHPFHV